jgi:IclR family transcriptional regulator, acetate operon repressor
MGPVPRSANGTYAIRPVDRVCDILDLLLDGAKGLSLGQVTEVTELPRNTAIRYLAVLEARQYVERDEHGHYGPGAAFQPFLSPQRNAPAQRTHPRLE